MSTLTGTYPLFLVSTLLVLSCQHRLSPEQWLEAARQANRAADEALVAGEVDRASRLLSDFIDAPRPAAMADDDVRVVVQDCTFRLAELELGRSEPAKALQWIERGLDSGLADDLFTANLHLSRGRTLEALGHDRQAADAYLEALRINEVLLRQAIEHEEDP